MEPQAELALSRVNSASYKTSDGTSVHHGSLNSVVGRLGIAAGRTLGNGSFYAKTSLVREFNADANVTLSSGGNDPVETIRYHCSRT